MMKTWRFWLTAIALFFVVANATGGDDYGLLMMISNPVYWLNELRVLRVSDTDTVRWLSYGVTLGFWLMVGYGIDRLTKRNYK